jgi:thiol-disulfide isomerase/thioredoxin
VSGTWSRIPRESSYLLIEHHSMIKRILRVATALGLLLAAVVSVLYVRNAAPAVPAISAAAAADARRPYVVKLHAQWCPVCMVTKGVWSQIEETYSDRVNLVVLDFTNDASTEASRATVARLGLDAALEEYVGATGVILVVDPGRKAVNAAINGSRNFAEYRAAIDAVLNK